MIAGISATRSRWITFFIILLGTQVLGLSGYVDGFYDIEGNLDWLTYQWSLDTLLYTALLWCSWLLLLVVVLKAPDELGVKVSASVLGSLPIALFGFIFIRSLENSDIVYIGG